MPKKNIPTYRLHKASGQAIVELDGNVFYLGKHKSKASRVKYDELIAEWILNGKQLPPTRRRNDLSVEELAIRYLEFAEGYYRKDGRTTGSFERARLALGYAIRYYGNKSVTEFGPLALTFCRDKMVAQGLSRKYCNTLVGILRQCFKWGVANEFVPPDVLHALQAVSGLREGRTKAPDLPPIEPVDDTIVEATLVYLSTTVADMVRVQRLCGCRPNEVVQMRLRDFDRTRDVWIFEPGTHKTKHHNKRRLIPIGPRCQNVLLKYLESKTEDEYVFSPKDADSERLHHLRRKRKTKVQPSQKDRSVPQPLTKPGLRYRVDSYGRAVERAAIKAGVERWRPNRLRHTSLSEFEQRFDLDTARVVGGHSSANTTLFYIQQDLQKAIDAAREIG